MLTLQAFRLNMAAWRFGWVFPAETPSGHIEPESLKRQHLAACKGDDKEDGEFSVAPFPLDTLRHTCLTRWAPHMDPWTLAYLAGQRDMAITKRYIHPQADTIREAMEKARVARGGHTSGHTVGAEKADGGQPLPVVN